VSSPQADSGAPPPAAHGAAHPAARPAPQPASDAATVTSRPGPGGSGGGPRVVTVGETMALMHSPGVGSLAHVPTVDVGVGGAESNVAIGLSRLGIHTAWLSRVGDDELGHRVVREIRAEGVEVIAASDPQRPTGLMIKSHPVADSTAVRYYRAGSAASALTPADLPAGLIENAEVLHLSGITPVLGETARDTVRSALERARSAGLRVSFDVNFRATLATRAQAAPILAEIAAGADIVFGGPEELSLLLDAAVGPGRHPVPTTPDDEEQLLRALAAQGIGEVVDKRGPDGAWALVGGELIEVAGHRVDVVDTVGAGDAFVAGYLSAHLQGLGPAERLARANACGAFMCMSPGDWEGAPTLTDLQLLTSPDAEPVRR